MDVEKVAPTREAQQRQKEQPGVDPIEPPARSEVTSEKDTAHPEDAHALNRLARRPPLADVKA